MFRGRTAPEEGSLAGYGALIYALDIRLPLPNKLALISKKKRQYANSEWQIFPSRYKPADDLFSQITFALKYEGVNLLILKECFKALGAAEMAEVISQAPLSLYSRKIWFLYEWMLHSKLDLPDLSSGNYVPLLDEKLQYGIEEGSRSPRHRIINNLPGTPGLCPLIFKTDKLENFLNRTWSREGFFETQIHKDVLQRASAFLLLKDSRASFSIEGENPGNQRALRWGKAIGQAGSRPLDKNELLRLRQLNH
ncbi:MAG: hypothetical protein U5L96_02220 [Owenweeksia sp.]|nr:hypothetical protein [Owenweeksia sp.]